ncbi:oxygen-independent coproporphyrinogen III oxidase [Aquibaculum sediminis]|uniref:oxygen-independent coproporphyrinogen III oxidase n=1 Tax=Aquibaculum sediminis TaxID=3231907 RepID=UPI003453776B
MQSARLLKHSRPVPRYTSYPTAPHFHPGVTADHYRTWLQALPADAPLSLYLHIPFCDTLCWFCGCHTRVIQTLRPVTAYVDLLLREFDLLTEALGGDKRPLAHLHFGGGSPSLLPPAEIDRIAAAIQGSFQPTSDAEIAVEIDPRGLDDAVIAAFLRLGVTRASVGVQDLNPQVQRAINRIQPFAVVQSAVDRLRAAGVGGINLDLMYGLPHQSVASVLQTAETILTLQPDRLALFGYAHVPHLKRHQRLLPEDARPDEAARLAQSEAVAARLGEAGYCRIGLDHFARPDDPLALSHSRGKLHRNFQGYTVDEAPILLGLGASAIGTLPQGYIQNTTDMPTYRQSIEQGHLPVARGLEVDEADRRERAVIESLMCHFEVDLSEHGGAQAFAPSLARLAPLIAEGLVELQGARVRVLPAGRPLVRVAAAAFDRYLQPETKGHARAL